jgi:hypothetical protein
LFFKLRVIRLSFPTNLLPTILLDDCDHVKSLPNEFVANLSVAIEGRHICFVRIGRAGQCLNALFIENTSKMYCRFAIHEKIGPGISAWPYYESSPVRTKPGTGKSGSASDHQTGTLHYYRYALAFISGDEAGG